MTHDIMCHMTSHDINGTVSFVHVFMWGQNNTHYLLCKVALENNYYTYSYVPAMLIPS